MLVSEMIVHDIVTKIIHVSDLCTDKRVQDNTCACDLYTCICCLYYSYSPWMTIMQKLRSQLYKWYWCIRKGKSILCHKLCIYYMLKIDTKNNVCTICIRLFIISVLQRQICISSEYSGLSKYSKMLKLVIMIMQKK